MGTPQMNSVEKRDPRSVVRGQGKTGVLLQMVLRAWKFADSDTGKHYIDLARLFAAAYAPYVLTFCFLIIALVSAWWGVSRYENFSLLRTDCTVFRAFLVGGGCFIATLLVSYFKLRPLPCYLLDFNCFKSVDEHKLSFEVSQFVTQGLTKTTSVRNMLFQLKVFLKSGLGEETYGPPCMFKNTMPSIAEGIEEMDHMMFGALDGLFSKTGLRPSQVDILIANISMFYPAPSLTSRVVNRYKMREDVRSYNISGMGCAAGMLAVDLAKDFLRVRKNKYIVIVGTENITLNWYTGNDRSMLVPNCLFRCGSYALLLTNIKAEKARSKLELLQSFRTTSAAKDASFDVIVTREDEDGYVGTSLGIKLLDVAGQALRINMAKLVPSMMPTVELLKAAVNFIERIVFKRRIKAYMPDFKEAFNHFCIHPGGRAVIDGIGENLGLSEYDMEPAKMTLHRFGNTSSSGLWYTMAYVEAKERLKKGEKVWQVGLGSGFKCNSIVWKVLRDIYPAHGYNPWMDVIHRYPIEIPTEVTPSHPHYKIVKRAEQTAREAIAAEEAERKREENQMKGLHAQRKVDVGHVGQNHLREKAEQEQREEKLNNDI